MAASTRGHLALPETARSTGRVARCAPEVSAATLADFLPARCIANSDCASCTLRRGTGASRRSFLSARSRALGHLLGQVLSSSAFTRSKSCKVSGKSSGRCPSICAFGVLSHSDSQTRALRGCHTTLIRRAHVNRRCVTYPTRLWINRIPVDKLQRKSRKQGLLGSFPHWDSPMSLARRYLTHRQPLNHRELPGLLVSWQSAERN